MKRQIFNPVVPADTHICGCEVRVFGKRAYLYGANDGDGQKQCSGDYVCFSAPVDDLTNWREEGVIYKRERDPLNPDGAHRLFPPDVCRGADGRYYLFYALDYMSIISVAVCDSPAGQYSFYGYVHFEDGHILSTREGEPFAFDPAILRDEGANYLYIGYCPYPPKHPMKVPKSYEYAKAYRLDDDMLTISGEPANIAPSFSNSAGTGFEGHEFLCAPSVRRAGGKFYLLYSSRHGHELCYAAADGPEGPFKFGGTVVSNGDIGIGDITDEADCNNYIGDNHGCIQKIGGKWYVFYHRHTNRNANCRQVCAEEITFSGDGSIPQAEMTSCGLNGALLEGRGTYPAHIACILKSRSGTMRGEVPLKGIHPYICPDDDDGRQYIANFRRYSVCGFKYFTPQGADRITVTARGSGRGKLVASDGTNTLATIQLVPSERWTKFSAPFKNPEGEFELYLLFFGDGAADIAEFTLD